MLVPRQFAHTDLFISPLGLGTVKFGRNTCVKYPQAFNLPSDKQIKHLLAQAHDLGINLLDTAAAYGISEQRLGKLLSNRQDWVIIAKAGESFENNISTFDFTREALLASVEQSLQQLKTDYIDIFLIHSAGNDLELHSKYDVFGTINMLKRQGKIRYGGISTKTIAGGMLAIEHSDCAMISYNLDYQDELTVIAKAVSLNRGILVKKALASGHLATQENALERSLELNFSTPGIGSVIIGTINSQHLRQNVELAHKILT